MRFDLFRRSGVASSALRLVDPAAASGGSRSVLFLVLAAAVSPVSRQAHRAASTFRARAGGANTDAGPTSRPGKQCHVAPGMLHLRVRSELVCGHPRQPDERSCATSSHLSGAGTADHLRRQGALLRVRMTYCERCNCRIHDNNYLQGVARCVGGANEDRTGFMTRAEVPDFPDTTCCFSQGSIFILSFERNIKDILNQVVLLT